MIFLEERETVKNSKKKLEGKRHKKTIKNVVQKKGGGRFGVVTSSPNLKLVWGLGFAPLPSLPSRFVLLFLHFFIFSCFFFFPLLFLGGLSLGRGGSGGVYLLSPPLSLPEPKLIGGILSADYKLVKEKKIKWTSAKREADLYDMLEKSSYR